MTIWAGISAFLRDDVKRSALLMTVSATALAVSFFCPGVLQFDVAWVAILLCGTPILYDAVTGLARLDIKADVLVAMAIVASVYLGEYFAAGEVALIMAIGGFLEDVSAAKSNEGIERLVKMTPRTGRVVRGGAEAMVPSGEIAVGETLRVFAGEVVPVDGRILSGTTSIDQSALTGESMPVDKGAGDEVFSGTVNQMGTFDMVSTKPDGDSSMQRLAKMVESADASKVRIVRAADRWATWLVAIVAVLAVAAYALSGSIERAVTVMIVFCPCAFILATPTAVVAAIGNAAKHNILVRDGDGLERMASVDRIAFDKTGTLTEGRPAVSSVVRFGGMSEDEVLRAAASAESRSEHPLGKALASSASGVSSPDDFEMIIGRGVRARVSGSTVLVGNEALMDDDGIEVPGYASSCAHSVRSDGSTAVFVAADGILQGMIALSDVLRPDAPAAVAAIRASGAECVLLTGDNARSAGRMASAVGITEVRAECTPEDKLSAVRGMQADGHKVCMVGDGINDAPALRAADVGVAMGGLGSDIAVRASDMALIGDDIGKMEHVRLLSKKMMRKVNVNIAFSMAWNFAAVALAMSGVLGPVEGALVHNFGSVVVVVNSMMLLFYAGGRASAPERTGADVEKDQISPL
jgi:heavy metal translocating P-type ATPase